MHSRHDWVQDAAIRPLIAAGPPSVEAFFRATFAEGEFSVDRGLVGSIARRQEPERPHVAERPCSAHVEFLVGGAGGAEWDFASDLALAIPLLATDIPDKMVLRIEIEAGGQRFDRVDAEQLPMANWLAERRVRVLEEAEGDVALVPVCTMLSMVPKALLRHHGVKVVVELHPDVAPRAERVRLVGARYTVHDKARLRALDPATLAFLGTQHSFVDECVVGLDGALGRAPGNFNHPVFLLYVLGLDARRLRGLRLEVVPTPKPCGGAPLSPEVYETVGAWSAAELEQFRQTNGFGVEGAIIVPLGARFGGGAKRDREGAQTAVPLNASFLRGTDAVFANESLNLSGVLDARLVVDTDEIGAPVRVCAVHYMPYIISQGMAGMQFCG